MRSITAGSDIRVAADEKIPSATVPQLHAAAAHIVVTGSLAFKSSKVKSRPT
jgi:pentose-5-phosphate-3-epimerase